MKTWTKLASAGLATLLIVLVIAGGAPTNAQDTGATPVATLAATLDVNATLDVSAMIATPTVTPTKKPGFGLNRVKALLDATVLVTHLTQGEVSAALGMNKTLTQIATDNKVDPTAIKAAAVTDLTAQIKAAVSAGMITQAQANALTKSLDKELTAIMIRIIPQPTPPAIAFAQSNITNILFQEAARSMGMSQRDLLQALRSGQSLTQIATANNIDPAAIMAAATKSATTYINARLKSTSLSQADATILLNALPAELATLMNKTNFLGKNDPQATVQATIDATFTATLAATPAQ